MLTLYSAKLGVVMDRWALCMAALKLRSSWDWLLILQLRRGARMSQRSKWWWC